MVRAQLMAIPRRREITKSTLRSWVEYVFGQRVNTREQAAMKFGNSEIFPENSGGGSTLGSRRCSWRPVDVCEDPTCSAWVASSSWIRRSVSLWVATRSLYSSRVGRSTLGDGSVRSSGGAIEAGFLLGGMGQGKQRKRGGDWAAVTTKEP